MFKINARDCVIKDVNKKVEREFLNSNHIQGFVKGSTVCYGLYLNGELVQIMSLGKPRYSKSYQWELIRDCSKKGYIIRGGVSRLWKYFLSKNKCRNCICYSFSHTDSMVTKYIDNCGFYNISHQTRNEKPYYIGEYNGKKYEIPVNNLRRYGVDAILGTGIGFNSGNNVDILNSLGFIKEYRETVVPQIDIYYPFSVVYRVDDLDDGSFYIGMCESEINWNEGYKGSGSRWSRHLHAHPDHNYLRKVIKSNFKTPIDTRKFEKSEIEKVINDNSNLNLSVRIQNTLPANEICPECGHKQGKHKASCSKYSGDRCPECNGVYGQHKANCSKNKRNEVCPECGAKRGMHYRNCSQFDGEVCSECGGIYGKHKKTCSYYKMPVCPECGASINHHKKICSHYKKPTPCPECGGLYGHYSTCSRAMICEECGGVGGSHKKNCSKYNKPSICPECGCSYSHKKTCSHYKQPEPCPECGSLKNHKSWCSRRKSIPECPECGGKRGMHKKTCSKYYKNRDEE